MRYRITDYQAFLGGLAMLIIGLILSLKSIIYVNIEYYGSETIRARWLWEFALSLQILAFAFMWAAHHTRVIGATGRWRKRAIIHAILGLLAVTMPVGLMLLAAYMDWFRFPPSSDVVKRMIEFAALIWLFSNVALPMLLGLVYNNGVWSRFEQGGILGALKILLKRYWPGVLMIAGLVLSKSLESNLGYIFAPFLGYLQGSFGYFNKAFRPQTASALSS